MKLITPIAIMAASAMAENCLPPNPPTSIAGALGDFSNSIDQCISSAANVLSASAANIINLQADKIAHLEEDYASCKETVQIKDDDIESCHKVALDNKKVIDDLLQTVQLSNQAIDQLEETVQKKSDDIESCNGVVQDNKKVIAGLQQDVALLEKYLVKSDNLWIISAKNGMSKVKLVNARFSDGSSWEEHQAYKAIDGEVITLDSYGTYAHTSRGNGEKTFIANVDCDLGAHIEQITLIPRQEGVEEVFTRYQQMDILLQKPDGSLEACWKVNGPFTSAVVKASLTSGLVWNCDINTTATAIYVKNPNKIPIQIAEITATGVINPEPIQD